VVDPFLPRPLWTRGHEWATATQRWLAGSLGVSLAATAGSTPLIGWHFHMATPIAPLASLALIPVTMVLLALALAAAAIAPVAPPLTRALNHLNAGVARASVAIAEGAARVPGSHFMLPSPGRRTEELVVFDLPYGAAAVLFDPGKDGVFLLDCGDQWSVRQSLLPALRHAGRNLTDLLLSHPDGGHLGGAATLCRADPPARVFLPVGDARSPGFQRLLAAAPASGATLTMLQAGQTIDCAPHARWVVVATADPRDRDALADDRCALLRLEWHGWRILFTADSGFRTERKLVESRADLAADVLVLGRHRTDPGGSEPFLAAVGARIVIASHDEFPPAERLAGPLRARLAAGGATVISQGEAGAVILTATSGHLTARGFLGGPQAGLCRSGAGGR
jgi:competence protein ComEC